MDKKTILIISHAHPKFSKGGGEIAAYNLFQELNRQGYDAYFVGAHHNEKAHHGYTSFSTVNDREILYFAGTPYDHFKHTSMDKRSSWKEFADLLELIRPDIIHFHHFVHLGLEKIREAYKYKQRRGGDVGIFLTLHEYIAICANNGQMVKRDTGALCYESDFVDCSKCFPEKNPTDFYLREIYIKSFFELIDHFISPSHFLIERYADWGIGRERISMLENGQVLAAESPKTKRELKEGEKRGRFAYFGQINTFKGLDLLLESFDFMDKKSLKNLHLSIHGSGLENQPKKFRKKVERSMCRYRKHITFYGPYEPADLPDLMSEADWVIIPSSWWENSPLVIQEAFKFGRPVIAADIGGMAEKVTDNVDGLHFKARNAGDLAEKITLAVSDEGLYDRLFDGIATPLSIEESAKEHTDIYKSHFKD